MMGEVKGLRRWNEGDRWGMGIERRVWRRKRNGRQWGRKGRNSEALRISLKEEIRRKRREGREKYAFLYLF